MKTCRMKAVLALLLLLVPALAAPVFSNAASAAATAADTFSDPAMEARARNLQRQFRCLVCAGENVDESGSPFSADVRRLIREQIAAGRVTGLGTTGPEPSPLLPGLPTIAATVPGFEASIWLGLMMPAGTPAPAIARLHDAVNSILTAAATRAGMARGGAQPMPMSVAAFDAFLRHDIERQGEWIRLARIEAG